MTDHYPLTQGPMEWQCSCGRSFPSESAFAAHTATVPIPHPHYCPHGHQIGWHHADDPDVMVDDRFCSPCPRCHRDDWMTEDVGPDTHQGEDHGHLEHPG